MATKTRRLADFLANIDDDSKVTSAGLLDATITATDLAPNSVDTSELVNDAVTSDKIGTGAVVADGIGAGAVVAAGIGTGAVVEAKLGDGAVTAAKIGSDVIEVKPHIVPDILYPAVNGILIGQPAQTFVDSSASGHIVTAMHGAHHSNIQKKVGTSSIRVESKDTKSGFNSNGDGLEVGAIGSADWDFGTGAFTIEFWWMPTELHTINMNLLHTVITAAQDTDISIIAMPAGANNLIVNSGTAAKHAGGTGFTVNVWHHIAVTRDGSNNLKIYINGTVSGSTYTTSWDIDPADPIQIGRGASNGGKNTSGYFDEIRIVKGKQVYTGNFTPPTALTTTGGTYSSATNVVNPTSGETKLLINSDNSSHSGAYGTAQSDSKKYYYTDIKGSSPINDPRIGAHYGSHRHMTKSVQLLKRESGANSRKIYSVDGREWCRGALSGVSYGADSAEVIYYGNGDYMEITGYFSDAQIQFHNIASRHINYTLDGVNNSTNFASASVTTPQAGRYVPAGGVQNLGLGATLGIHTLKLRHVTTGASNFQVSFELFVQDTQDFTATNATNILTSVGHTLSNGDEIILTGSDLPNGLSAATKYYVIGVSGNNFQVATTSTGSAVAFSDDGSGTRTFTALNNVHIPAQDVISYGKKLSVSAAGHHYNPFAVAANGTTAVAIGDTTSHGCLLYTSDAADE